uniref:tRNA-specific adenosine deaminase 1 n=1 Tax=Trypanosoma congolense (strain IL3000) TaxID=1068625 RepID=G0UXL5_TRYCI|nr:unnamed protein product [Trypanosoma congolense IL3000]
MGLPPRWLPYSDTPPEAFAVALHFQCQRGGWGPTTLAALEGRDGVVAGIVLGLPFFHADGSPFSRFVCVSLGCGTRCVGYSPSELIREADLTLRDGHAEVLARRGFVAFLLDAAGYLSESQERQHPFVSRCRYAPQTAGRDKCFDPGWECYRLQQGVTVHLICTQYLCGAMSVPFSGAHPILATPSGRCLFPCSLSDEGLRGIQEQSPLCEVISTDTASFLDNSVACFGHKIAVHRGHVANELPLIGRVKPGKGFQNLCMSCSDKLLRWQCLGIQGRRRTRLFPERIHLSSVWVPNTTPLVSSSCTTQCKESSLERARESLNGRKHYLLPRLFTAGTQAGTVGSEDSAGCCGDPPVVDVCGFELADLQPLLAWMKSSQTEDERNIMEDGKNDSCWSRSAWVKVGIGNSGVALCPRNRKRQKGEDECIDDGDHCSLCWCEKSILILNTKAGIPRGVTQQYMHRTVQRLLRFQQGTVSEEGSTGASLAGFLESVAARFPLSRLWMTVRQCAITHGGLRSFSRVSEESQSALKLKFGDIFNGDCSAGSFFFPVRLVSVDGLGEQRTIVAGGSVHFWLGESQRRMDHLSELTVEKKHGCIQPLLWVEKHSQFVS